MLHNQCVDMLKLQEKASNFLERIRGKIIKIFFYLEKHLAKSNFPIIGDGINILSKCHFRFQTSKHSFYERFVRFRQPDAAL